VFFGDRSARQIQFNLERIGPHVRRRAEAAGRIIRGARITIAGALSPLAWRAEGRGRGRQSGSNDLRGDEFTADGRVKAARGRTGAQRNQAIESPLGQFVFEELHIGFR